MLNYKHVLGTSTHAKLMMVCTIDIKQITVVLFVCLLLLLLFLTQVLGIHTGFFAWGRETTHVQMKL